MFSIKWEPYWGQWGVAPKVLVDDHSVWVSAGVLPFIDLSVEAYFRKNYYVKRGIYFDLNLFGLRISRDPDGEGGAKPSGKECPICGTQAVTWANYCDNCGNAFEDQSYTPAP